jgi:hypothetical protein
MGDGSTLRDKSRSFKFRLREAAGFNPQDGH